ncbi:hypothetical protein AEAC466_10840, partial [Asticcacaulis sp. AC466]|uniref:triose-phosphate isomerase n=1 Tax=Asticcacaulis sp. AC466 TaxID=1282362 RepID=UPI0003C3F588
MRLLIAGNWKMHGLNVQLSEIVDLAANVKMHSPKVDILICPPATLIERSVRVAGELIAIGGQDCHSAVSGPYTGDISAEMLTDAGATAVIIGHSERRQHHGETNTVVHEKAMAARRSRLMAITCIGETIEERRSGRAMSVCADQIIGSVPIGTTGASMAVAYEPPWAIGAGDTATSDEIMEMHIHIRTVLVTHLGTEGNAVRILYGGSVNADNAGGILILPDVGGALGLKPNQP